MLSDDMGALSQIFNLAFGSIAYVGAMVGLVLGLAMPIDASGGNLNHNQHIANLKKRLQALEEKRQSCHWSGRLEIECPNGYAGIEGRIMYDALFIDSNKDNYEAPNSSALRRARIALYGEILNTWSYMLEFDGATEHKLKEVWFSYDGLSNDQRDIHIIFGNLDAPFSLQQVTSSRFLYFMERVIVADDHVVPERLPGLYFSVNTQHWSLAGGIHSSVYSRDVSEMPFADDALGLVVRATWAPIYDRRRYLHLGLGWRYLDPVDDHSFTDFSGHGPLSEAIAKQDLFGDGPVPQTKYYMVVNPELAFGNGPFGFQGEFFYVPLFRETSALPDLTFYGWYAQANWWLTGEHNNYDPEDGAFERVSPKRRLSDGGIGAIGLGVRIQSGNFTSNDYRGGRLKALTANLTWKPNPYVKWRLEYILIDRDKIACKECVTTNGERFSAIQTQIAIDF